MRVVPAVVVLVITGMVVACAAGPSVPVTPPTGQTTVACVSGQTCQPVTRGTIRTFVSSSGTVLPAQEVLLNFTSGTTIRTVNVAIGQRVRPNDVLGTIDTTDLLLSLQQQNANVASAQAKYDTIAMGATDKDIQTAQANVDTARAKYQATATTNPKDIEVARANLDSAIASYNATVQGTTTPQDIANAEAAVRSAQAKYAAIVNGTTTPQDIANAEASVRSAQAKLDAVRAGAAKQDIISAQNKTAQSQSNLDKVKSDSAAAKEQARIKWESSADATRDAQRRFDIANATFQQALANNTDPAVSGSSSGSSGSSSGSSGSTSSGGTSILGFDGESLPAPHLAALGTPGVTPVPVVIVSTISSGSGAASATTAPKTTSSLPTITPLKLATYKQAADSAYLTVQQALKTQESNRLAYEQAKQDEINNINTAQQALNDSQSSLSKLLAGPLQEDVTQAQATVDQAKSQLDKLKRGPTDTDLQSAQAAIDQAQAQLDKLKRGPTASDLAKAQASVDSARATLNDLLAGPKATDLTQAQASVNSAVAAYNDIANGPKKSDLETALAALDQAKAQRDQAQLKVDQGAIKAPFAAVLTQVNAVPGQVAAATAATPNFDLVDDSQLHIDVSVSEADSSNVKVGQTATVTLDSAPGQPVTGNVERINPTATTTSNVTAFVVRIALTSPPANVRPGATATVQITTNTRQNVLTVPSRAVQTVNGQPAVTVFYRNSTFLVPVQTGLSDGRNTEVISGVSEGDVVVLPRAGTTTTGGGAPGGGAPGGPGR